MTLKITEHLFCDRCDIEYTKHGTTLEIGWFKLTNGSGSKSTNHNRPRTDLDYDLCQGCTAEFFTWYKHPTPNGDE